MITIVLIAMIIIVLIVMITIIIIVMIIISYTYTPLPLALSYYTHHNPPINSVPDPLLEGAIRPFSPSRAFPRQTLPPLIRQVTAEG